MPTRRKQIVPNSGNGAVGDVVGRNGISHGTSGAKPTRTAVTWSDGVPVGDNYAAVGMAIAKAAPGRVYWDARNGGLFLIIDGGQVERIEQAKDLAPLLADLLDITIIKGDKIKKDLPTASHLAAMLRSKKFLGNFLAVDIVTTQPMYGGDYTLLSPGYHNLGPRQRVLYLGPAAKISDSLATINKFLDVMPFDTNADRTNAVAGGLFIRLRHLWPGQNPLFLCTATKSHAGKTTLIEFIRGIIAKAKLLYERIDWPMRQELQRQLKANPDVGVIDFDNVRLDSSGYGKLIRSGFLESLITDKEVVLAAPGGGGVIRVPNHFVVLMNTNEGLVGTDLLNRAVQCHLALRGSFQDQDSPIGNPKYEFLPKHQDQIDAEFRWMIEAWRLGGCPIDKSIQHPMSHSARVVGGILQFHGFTDFLANRSDRKTSDDPLREAIGLLGAARPNKALRPGEWADLAVAIGVLETLIAANQRTNAVARERAMGVVLARHLAESFDVRTETDKLRLRLDGGIRRWQEGKNPHTRYRFDFISSEPLPLDEGTAPDGRVAAEANKAPKS